MTLLANHVRRVSSADGAIVLHLRRGTMFRVNPMGMKILDLLERDVGPAKITEQLSAEFEVPLEVVRNDLERFLESLKIHGVLDSVTENA